jgi:hypothetical protein
MAQLKKYIWNLLISIDQLVNALLGGDPDETVSSRCGKRTNCRFCKWLCDLLHKLDYRHCEESIEQDEGKDGILR